MNRRLRKLLVVVIPLVLVELKIIAIRTWQKFVLWRRVIPSAVVFLLLLTARRLLFPVVKLLTQLLMSVTAVLRRGKLGGRVSRTRGK